MAVEGAYGTATVAFVLQGAARQAIGMVAALDRVTTADPALRAGRDAWRAYADALARAGTVANPHTCWFAEPGVGRTGVTAALCRAGARRFHGPGCGVVRVAGTGRVAARRCRLGPGWWRAGCGRRRR
jgi:hypothetical protein